MADKLATVVGNTFTRVQLMQPLALPGSISHNKWVVWSQTTPYWCNRIARLTEDGEQDTPTYTLTIQMRLILSFQQNITREDGVATNPQVGAWSTIPTVTRYFAKYRTLKPPGMAALTHFSSGGVMIACTRGLDLQRLPISGDIVLSTDFELTVPFVVGQEE